MKRCILAPALLLAAPIWAAYTYYFTDTLAALNPSNWTQAGTVTVNNGFTATDPSGGSLISRVAVPDGTSEYEVKATVTLTANGGNYTLFGRATSDARTGGG